MRLFIITMKELQSKMDRLFARKSVFIFPGNEKIQNGVKIIYRVLAKAFFYLISKISRLELSEHADFSLQIRPAYSVSPLHQDIIIKIGLNSPEKVDECILAVYSNAYLIGPYGLPFTSKGRLILEPIQRREILLITNTMLEMGVVKFLTTYLKLFLGYFRVSSTKFHSHNLLYLLPRIKAKNNLPHYGHWIGEHLSQLSAMGMKFDDNQFMDGILTNSNMPSWQIQSLEVCLKNDPLNIVHYEQGEKIVKIKNLGITTLKSVHSEAYEFDPLYRKIAQSMLTDSEHRYYPDKAKSLLIARQQDKYRKIINFEEVMSICRSAKILNHDPYEYDLIEEIEVLRGTNFIIGPFGSNLIKPILCADIKKLVEISAKETVKKKVWKLMCVELGIEYSMVSAESNEGKDYSNWLIDPQELRNKLSVII